MNETTHRPAECLRNPLRCALTVAGLQPDHVKFVTTQVLEDPDLEATLTSLLTSARASAARNPWTPHHVRQLGERASTTWEAGFTAGYRSGWASACRHVADVVLAQLERPGRIWLSSSAVTATRRAGRVARDLAARPSSATDASARWRQAK